MFWKKAKPTPLMAPEEVAQAIAEGRAAVIVDVRSPEQFCKGHLPGAINIPLSELERNAGGLDPATPTVFY